MKRILFTVVILLTCLFAVAADHPSLMLTGGGVAQMRASRGTAPAFDASIARTLSGADAALASPIVVPEPRDGGGGYTHEWHKLNYYEMVDCGIAWQLTGEKKYARRVADMLAAYAKLYPTLGFHPMTLSKSPGRIFWQTLNESVWLVHTSMAYDCVYDYMTPAERKAVERDLFRPMADFLMNGLEGNRTNTRIYNSMHNHATWATSAVGMIGMVMGDQELVNKSLYGTDQTGDNGGFIRQLDYLFSPDGYFTEGAYYQRYAIWPFMVFAQCIDNNRPDLKIFEYRDRILLKAVSTLLQLAYDGRFMRFNDALEKGYDAQELVYAVNIAYNADPSDKMLLDVAARYQDWVLPTDAGYAVARDIARGEAQPLRYTSRLYRDGRDGTEGGVAVIRSTDPALNSAVTLKATAHGLSHGHYDKLTLAYYDNGNEILADYGAARWLNIEAKYKGHYTRENKTFAMSTVAHNTLVVDEGMHFGGSYDESMKYHSDIWFTDFSGKDIQIVSARDEHAYPDVRLHRTVAYVTTPFLQYPLLLDILRAESATPHSYDYPVWYGGHMVSLNFPYEKALTTISVMGDKPGYMHLWRQAWGHNADSGTTCFTWIAGNRFYSINSATTADSEMVMVQAGANDPDFNLRPANAYMIREQNKGNHTFFSSIETHGTYDLQVEQSDNLTSSCVGVRLLADTPDYTVARADYAGGHSIVLCIANRTADAKTRHSVKTSEGTFTWTGPYDIIVK
ncbi:alginate lyase family protein [uncultured Alistipes sp.]|uniref:alginate lyase family protein n=1 Tax=uncultured Alistipes sp. TaxID=538949 RepID=UPI0025E654C2|nr:alginate lyase family protein [uncultured Alistipes sp.]